MKFDEAKFHVAIKSFPIGLTKRQQGHVMGAARAALTPDAATPVAVASAHDHVIIHKDAKLEPFTLLYTQPRFRVHVAPLRASNGTTYVVCIDRTDMEVDKFGGKGRITPFESANEQHAMCERAVWDRFLNGDGSSSMAHAMEAVGMLDPIDEMTSFHLPVNAI